MSAEYQARGGGAETNGLTATNSGLVELQCRALSLICRIRDSNRKSELRELNNDLIRTMISTCTRIDTLNIDDWLVVSTDVYDPMGGGRSPEYERLYDSFPVGSTKGLDESDIAQAFIPREAITRISCTVPLSGKTPAIDLAIKHATGINRVVPFPVGPFGFEAWSEGQVINLLSEELGA